MREKIRRALEEKRAEAKRLYAAFDEARKAAAAEGADITNTESEAFKRLEEAHKAYAAVEQEAKTLEDRYVQVLDMESALEPKSAEAEPAGGQAGDRKRAPSAAEAFLTSDAYKDLVRSGALEIDKARINMTPVKALDRAELKTLLTGASDTSGGAFVVEDRQAGYVDIPRRPLVVADLVTVGDTDSDAVEYVELTSRTNAAAETPEATSTGDAAANAPESGLAFAVKIANVREITHYIPATRRALADAGQLRTIVDQELRDGILERLDSQLVVGDGTGENLRGILNTPGLLSQLIGTDSLVDAIHKAITQVVLQNHVPDAVLFHPTDWQTVRLSKDSNGQYLFGPPSQAGATTIWGYPVVLSQAVPAGTTLVGAFRRGATLWVRSGVTIAATDAHADWFIRRLVAVLASYRAAFAVQRPKAFCEVSAT
jgi:HK97 family phage major capsid protein